METELLTILTDYLDSTTYPPHMTATDRTKLRKQAQNYLLREGKLYKKNRISPDTPQRVISKQEMDIILYNMHTDPIAGHFGIKTTVQRILERYYWPTLGRDVRQYIQTCDACQRRGKPQLNELLSPIKVGQPFSKVGIDIVGPLNETKGGNKYIVTATDYLTKWPEAKAIPTARKEEIAKFLWEDIICRHGCPKELLSDRGAVFLSGIIEKLLVIIGTKHQLTSPYHPQTNGLTERFNKTLCESLARTAMDHDKQWDLFVTSTLLAYRTLKHGTTKETPFYLTYGRQATLPVELEIETYPEEELTDDNFLDCLKRRTGSLIGTLVDAKIMAKENIRHSQELMKARHDRKVKHNGFKEEDLVLEYRSQDQHLHGDKFRSQWNGPYRIGKVLGHGAYILKTMEGHLLHNRPVHGNRLKQYHARNNVTQEAWTT